MEIIFLEILKKTIITGKTRFKEIKDTKKAEQLAKMKSDKKFQTDQLINNENSFFAEIKTRYNTLCLKCDIILCV